MKKNLQRVLSGWILFSLFSSFFLSFSPFAKAETVEDTEDYFRQNRDFNPSNTLTTSGHSDASWNGSFTYAYSLDLPKGRDGFSPQLSLNYDSSNQNLENWLGLGWSMTIPSITRSNKNGVDSMYERTDFVSSFDGELVPVELTDGVHGIYGAKNEKGSSIVYEFRTDSSWRLVDKSGTESILGYDTSSRQDDASDPDRIYSWLIQQVTDPHGNSILYSYDKDEGQIYPNSIEYTNHDTDDGLFNLSFDYETRDDISSMYSAGFKVTTSKRLNSLTLAVDGVDALVFSLDYSNAEDTTLSLLHSITRKALNPDESWIIENPTVFEYEIGEKTWTQETDFSIPLYFYEGDPNGVQFFDINGDSLPDFVQSSFNGTTKNRVYLKDADDYDWSLASEYEIPILFEDTSGDEDRGITFGDLNGDHLLDLIKSAPGSGGSVFKSVYLKNRSDPNWTLSTSFTPPEYIYEDGSHPNGVSVDDMNGDGLADFARSYYDSSTTYSQKLYSNTGELWDEREATSFPIYFWINSDFSYLGYRTIDVNGDGLTDLVQSSCYYSGVDDIRQHVYLNNGEGSWVLDSDYVIPVCFWDNVNGYAYRGIRFADINGDQLPDILDYSFMSSSDYGHVYINNGDGTGWSEIFDYDLPLPLTDTESWTSVGTHISDINGDNLPDFIESAYDSGHVFQKIYTSDQKHQFLSKIISPKGVELEVTYKNSAQYVNADGNMANPNLPFSLTTVESISTNDGLGNVTSRNFNYEGGAFLYEDALNRQFAGFATVTESNETQKIKTSYLQDSFATIGKPYRTDVYDEEDKLFSSTVDTWESTDLGDDRTFVAKTAEVTLTYDGLSSHRDSAVEYTYDEEGNVETVVNYGEVDADEDGSFTDVSSTDEKSTTTYSYAVDSGGVIRNKVSEQKITNSSGLTLQKTRYFYDDLSYGSVSTGNLTREAKWQSAGDTWVNTDYTYDSYGLISSVKNPRGFTTSYTYDAAHLYPEVSSNPKGFTVTRSYDYATGKITSQTDENGYTSETTYDGLGRVLTISVPDPSTGTLTELSSTSYDDDSVPNSISTTTSISGVTSESVTYLDGFGRTVETNTLAEDGNYSTVDTWYDEQGNLAQQTLPYFSSSSAFGRDDSAESTFTTYDVLNRPLTVTTPTGSTSYDYSLWATTVTDPNGNDKVYSYSAAGQLVQVEEANGAETYSTVYHYNPLGQLVQLTDDQGSVRHFHYDTLGRKISQEDLHAASESSFGSWTYLYDPNNNLVSQTDPKGQTITWAYDQLDRPTYEDWDSSTTPHEILYFYDTAPHGHMKLAQVKSNFNDFVVTYTGYDALGNLSSEMHSTKKPGLSTYYDYAFQTSYDLLSRPTKVVYPGGALTVNTSYNATGQVEKVTRGPTGSINVISDMDYNAAGQITSMAYANGVTTTNVYDAAESYRLGEKISTGVYSGTSGNIQDQTYSYDDNGNITGIVDDSITPTNKTLTYSYDDLNRLLTASSSGFAVGDYSESYSYDSVGNLTSKSDVGTLTYSGTGASSGSYSGANPHAVTGVGTSAYTYDLNGNLTGDGTHTYSWDKRNHLSASGTLSYSYDNTGSRYKTVDTSSGPASFNYYVSRYEELRGGTTTTPGSPTYYIFAGSQRVATFEAGSFFYVLQDHLGGTSLVTNSAGAVDQIYDYFPYGSEAMNTRLGTNDVRHSFTDKELEDPLGLYYFEARWYNPSIGRFIGQDPMQYSQNVAKILSDPERLNYYAYSGNNPIKYVDMTGESWNPTTWDVNWKSVGIGTFLLTAGIAEIVGGCTVTVGSAGAGTPLGGIMVSAGFASVGMGLVEVVNGSAGKENEPVGLGGMVETGVTPTLGPSMWGEVIDGVNQKLDNLDVKNQPQTLSTMNNGVEQKSTSSVYTVQGGDTLSGVFGDNWEKVASYNNLSNPNQIQVGQELKIPDTL